MTVIPDLTSYDTILINTSAGKDSMAMMDVVVTAARAAGIADRVVAVLADLGSAEWQGVPELAAEHADHYRIRFETVARRRADGTIETIADRVAEGKKWPDARNRWCTSDHKRGPIRTLMTQLAAEHRADGLTDRPVRILNCLGIRAAESKARAKRAAFRHDERASNKTKRHVDEWLPIHAWSVHQVWERISAAGTRSHEAYAAGMTRLSCRFCPLASLGDLTCSARLNPELATDYATAEAAAAHTFQARRSMADIIAQAAAPAPEPAPTLF